jgi:hypothetical protein
VSNPITLGFFAAALPQLVHLNAPLVPQWAFANFSRCGCGVGGDDDLRPGDARGASRGANPTRLALIWRGGIALIAVGITMLPVR